MTVAQNHFLRRHVAKMKKLAVTLCICLAGCSSLLPKGKSAIEGPWNSYEAAERTFDKIVPYQTRVADLKELGLDVKTTPNITILNYSDVLRRFIPNPSVNADDLDTGVKDCIQAKTHCRGFEIDQRTVNRVRTGNFWADWLNFNRTMDVTGWNFRGMLLVRDDLVVYKLVGGQPLIREQEKNKNPLGPLQGGGEAAVRGLY
jgi:hypothetical protein